MLELVAATLAVALAGGPGDAVATVDGDPIEKRTYRHWTRVWAWPGTAIGRSHRVRRRLTMRFLIQAKWIEHEAAERSIVVSDEEVRRRKNVSLDGLTGVDLERQIRLELSSIRIREHVLRGAEVVSESQVADYYNRHRERFAEPERRDLRLVLTRSRARAQRAKRALRSGRTWRAVAKRYSIDRRSRSHGGRVRGLVKGSVASGLERAAFKASVGRLVGPVTTPLGSYVFEVRKIIRAKPRSLEEAAPTIRGLLQSRNQARALVAFMKSFNAKWKARTECRRGYVVRECRTGGG